MPSDKILIIIPTYNERENIVLIIPQIRKRVPDAHILVVDDASPDGTSQCVKELSESLGNVYLLQREKKEGLGRAHWRSGRGISL